MESRVNRRTFMQVAGLVSASGALATPALLLANTAKKVVIIGGGSAGATAARYLKLADPRIDVTLIEQNKRYTTCYLSNEVIAGRRPINSLEFGYAGLKKEGIKLVFDRVTGLDATARTVFTANGERFSYTRCIVAPGIDFKYEQITGYDAEVARDIPHAWKAGSQTVLLRQQLQAMADGGTVVIAPPTNPYRCPPGPYERASLIADYLQREKPRSKIIIIDPKTKFSKMALFTQAWKKRYRYQTDQTMIEWYPETRVTHVDAKTRTVTHSRGESIQADVLNIIPPQKAGKIAFDAGLTNLKGWCPVAFDTFESSLLKRVHVIGDAISRGLPKSAYSANSEAKVCAAAVAALLHGKEPDTPSFVNTCYSIIGEEYGISVASVYRLTKDRSRIVKVAGGVSPLDATDEQRKREIAYAHSWFNNITRDIFGSDG